MHSAQDATPGPGAMTRADYLIGGMLSVLLAAWLVPFARIGLDPHHDGIMLKPALDVLSGQVLFRDTFMQYGALSCYAQVLALLVDPSLLALRLQTVGVYMATLFLLYIAWRQILPRSLALLASGLFILFIPSYELSWLGQYWLMLPWSSVFALMFQSLAVLALFRVIRGEQPERWGAVLGAACAGVFWCRQPVGIVMTGTVAATWIALRWTGWTPPRANHWRVLGWITGGFALVNFALLGGILASGAGAAWWYQNFVWPRKWVTGSITLVMRDFLKVFVHPREGLELLGLFAAAALPAWIRRLRPDLPRTVLAVYGGLLLAALAWQHERVLHVIALREGGWTVALPVLVIVQATGSLGLALFRRSAPKAPDYHLVAALAAVSLGALLQYYPVPDSWHIIWSLAPAFGLCLHLLWRALGWPAPVVALAVAALLAPAAVAKVRAARTCLAEPRVALGAPEVLRGLRVPAAQAENLARINAVVAAARRINPDIGSALDGVDALYLCFTPNRVNPSPYFVTWAALADPREDQKRWYLIERQRPLVFFHKADWVAVNDFYRRARYIPLLYLESEALELAVPREIADALGLKAYGAPSVPPQP